ncbi:MAG: 4-hydroxy-tetrahydrodipicolinate reductase, partial [Ilumatobacteraceae bacterium]
MDTAADARIRVGVNGAGGRMGSEACAAIAGDPHLDLVAAVGPRHAGVDVYGVTVGADLRAFADARCDVVVDFTVAAALRTTLPWLAMHGIHAVVGTSGVDDDDLEAYRSAFGSGPAHCVIAPNFAISAVLMNRLVEIAAPFFDPAEIIECEHRPRYLQHIETRSSLPLEALAGKRVGTISAIAVPESFEHGVG